MPKPLKNDTFRKTGVLSRPGIPIVLLLLVLVVPFLLIKPALSVEDLYSFTRMGTGARALGMGGTHVAITEDAFSTYWNPAGLGFAQGHQVGAMYANIFNFETNFSQISYIIPMTEHSMGGVDLRMLTTDSIPVTKLNSRFEPVIDYYTDHNAYEFKASYGYKFSNKFSSGINFKYIQENAADITGQGWGLDWGLQYRPIDDLWFGINVMDITDTEVNWDDNTDTIPTMIKAGVLAKFLDGKLNLAADFDVVSDQPLEWHIGSEYWFNKLLALRIGSDDSDFTFGMTYQQPRWSLDYAYLNHRLEDIHRFSITLFIDEINRHTISDRRKKAAPEELIAQYNRQPKDFKKQELDRLLEVKRQKEIILFKGGKKTSVFDTTDELDEMKPVLKTSDPDGQIDNKKLDPDIFFDEDVQTPPFRYRNKKRVTVIRKAEFRGTEFSDKKAASSSEIPKFTTPPALKSSKAGIIEKSLDSVKQQNADQLKGDSNLSPYKSSIKTIKSIKSLKKSSIPLINADTLSIERRRKTHVTKQKTEDIMAQTRSIELERIAQTRKEIELIKIAAIKFNGTEDGFLTNIHQLVGKYLKFVPKDPWGNQYKIEALQGILRSAGPDKTYNTEDDLINYYIDEIDF